MGKARVWLLVLMLLLTMVGSAQAAALGDRLLSHGARGSDVSELQSSLHQMGLLSVNPTGYFGPLTEAAVRQFQSDQGLVVDGIVGPRTIAALRATTAQQIHVVRAGDTLWRLAQQHGTTVSQLQRLNGLSGNMIFVGQRLALPATSSVDASRTSLTQAELDLLARLVYAESSGEPYLGKVAVAAVVLNRVDSPLFPNTVRGVVYERGQFEPVMNGRIYGGYTNEEMRAVREAVAGHDPTSGSLFFYNPWKVNHAWMASRPVVTVIGQHVFSR